MRTTGKAASKALNRGRQENQRLPALPKQDPSLRGFLEDLADLAAAAILARLKAPGGPSGASPGGSRIPRRWCCSGHWLPIEAIADACFAQAPLAALKTSWGFGGKTTVLGTPALTEIWTWAGR